MRCHGACLALLLRGHRGGHLSNPEYAYTCMRSSVLATQSPQWIGVAVTADLAMEGAVTCPGQDELVARVEATARSVNSSFDVSEDDIEEVAMAGLRPVAETASKRPRLAGVPEAATGAAAATGASELSGKASPTPAPDAGSRKRQRAGADEGSSADGPGVAADSPSAGDDADTLTMAVQAVARQRGIRASRLGREFRSSVMKVVTRGPHTSPASMRERSVRMTAWWLTQCERVGLPLPAAAYALGLLSSLPPAGGTDVAPGGAAAPTKLLAPPPTSGSATGSATGSAAMGTQRLVRSLRSARETVMDLRTSVWQRAAAERGICPAASAAGAEGPAGDEAAAEAGQRLRAAVALVRATGVAELPDVGGSQPDAEDGALDVISAIPLVLAGSEAGSGAVEALAAPVPPAAAARCPANRSACSSGSTSAATEPAVSSAGLHLWEVLAEPALDAMRGPFAAAAAAAGIPTASLRGALAHRSGTLPFLVGLAIAAGHRGDQSGSKHGAVLFDDQLRVISVGFNHVAEAHPRARRRAVLAMRAAGIAPPSLSEEALPDIILDGLALGGRPALGSLRALHAAGIASPLALSAYGPDTAAPPTAGPVEPAEPVDPLCLIPAANSVPKLGSMGATALKEKAGVSEEDAKLAATGTRTRVLHAEVHCFQQLYDLDTARGAHILVVELDGVGVGFDDAQPCRMCSRGVSRLGVAHILHTTQRGIAHRTTAYRPDLSCEALEVMRL